MLGLAAAAAAAAARVQSAELLWMQRSSTRGQAASAAWGPNCADCTVATMSDVFGGQHKENQQAPDTFSRAPLCARPRNTSVGTQAATGRRRLASWQAPAPTTTGNTTQHNTSVGTQSMGHMSPRYQLGMAVYNMARCPCSWTSMCHVPCTSSTAAMARHCSEASSRFDSRRVGG